MTEAQRAALLSALAGMGVMEFWPDSIESPDARIMFQGHQRAFDECSRAIAASNNREAIPFVFLSRSMLNACAFTKEGHQFIGMNWGSVIVIQDLFFRMLASPRVLPHIGDISVESDEPRLQRLEVDAAHLPCSDGHPFAMDVAPQDPARAFYALNLAQIALDFLFIHEHQHLVGGHLHLLPGTFVIEETQPLPTDNIFIRHVLELEADAAAANFSLGIASDRKGNAWRISPSVAPFLATEKSRHEAWLFSILTLFMLMEQANNRAFFAGHPPPLTHPAAVMRRAMLAILVFWRRGPFKKLDIALVKGATIVVQVHQALQAVAEDQEQIMWGLDLVGKSRSEDMKRLIACWRTLHPRLHELAAANGAEPAPMDLVETLAQF